MSFKSIETSAAKGCPLCLLFLDGMPSDDRISLQEQEGRYLSELRSTSGGTVDRGGNKWQVALFENPNVLTYRSPKPRTPPGRYIFKNIHLAPLKEPEPLIKERHLSSSTASASSWTVAKQWLNECTTEHRLCARKKNASLPTRLIDIGVSTTISPRLCETSEIASCTKYVTLSHCWGQYMPKKLLQDSFLSMKNRIELSDLSKTFQDVMKIVQYLGLRYIWIDSLCIYSDRTTMKDLRILRFAPQFSEGFNFTHSASRIWQYILPCL